MTLATFVHVIHCTELPIMYMIVISNQENSLEHFVHFFSGISLLCLVAIFYDKFRAYSERNESRGIWSKCVPDVFSSKRQISR